MGQKRKGFLIQKKIFKKPKNISREAEMLFYTLDWEAKTDPYCNATTVHVYGLDKDGTKVHKSIHGFEFRFWVSVVSIESMDELHGMLKSSRNTQIHYEKDTLGSIEVEKFSKKEQHFARVTSKCSVCLKRAHAELRNMRWGGNFEPVITFEGSMSPISRFLQKTCFSPHQWIAAPMHMECHINDLFDPKMSNIPESFCVCAFDIECLSHDCISFPDATKPNDTMEQIGLVLTYPFGSRDDEHIMISLQSIDVSEDYELVLCDTEEQMFTEFSAIVNEKVHFLTSYNGYGFDFPYMIARCNVNEQQVFKKTFSTAAFGCQNYTLIEFAGVLQLDLLVHIRKEKKLESYKLDDVAQLFLSQKKHDVSPRMIFKSLRDGTQLERTSIARYCLQDCALVCRLLRKFAVLRSLFAMCEVTFCPFRKMTISGQQARTLDLLSRNLHENKLLLPDKHSSSNFGDDTYEGATVLEAHAGLYNDPVAGLDFASLYPSIIIAMNLCVSTRYEGEPSDKDLYNNVNGVYFLKEPRGVIPTILNYLWKTRKATRSTMKSITDQDTLDNMQAQQLSYKLVMNSMYGFLGSSYTPIETKSIAKAVTFYGRHLLEQTQQIILKTYGDQCQVVYGDSVTGDTLVRTEYGNIPIENLGEEWEEYRHMNHLQEVLGKMAQKQVSRSTARCLTTDGIQKVQYVVRRRYEGQIFCIKFDDGTSLKITPDHCIWDGKSFVSAKSLSVGQNLPALHA